ncbi:MAG: class I SAM-dependent methyltransferase [Anaerolineae bacterium]|nr:class I SAM-dependent methyltransferase [Anaerolineae bacterium]
MGIENARFVYVEPGAPLPFDDESFDGVTAASSVEQTPDPQMTLREIYRILRPGGRLRVYYEALSRYRGHPEWGAWLLEVGERRSRLMLSERDIDGEREVHYGITLDATVAEAAALLAPGADEVTYEALSVSCLERARPWIVEAVTCTLTHPSGRTLAAWLSETGFTEVMPTHSGGRCAWGLYEALTGRERPGDLEALDAYLGPIVQTMVRLLAPIETDPMITAVK